MHTNVILLRVIVLHWCGVDMRITSKGQVTIPIEIRTKFGLLPETEIDFVVVDGAITIKKISENQRAANLIKRMSGAATIKMTTDEIMDLTRKE